MGLGAGLVAACDTGRCDGGAELRPRRSARASPGRRGLHWGLVPGEGWGMLFPLPHHLHGDLERFLVLDPASAPAAESGPRCNQQQINEHLFPGRWYQCTLTGRQWAGAGRAQGLTISMMLHLHCLIENHPEKLILE